MFRIVTLETYQIPKKLNNETIHLIPVVWIVMSKFCRKAMGGRHN